MIFNFLRSFQKRLLFKKAGKKDYKWALLPPIDYGNGITFTQISQDSFSLNGLRDVDMKQRDTLLRALEKHSPVDTGRLRSHWMVIPLEVMDGRWAFVISNQMWYFKFAWHYYRGEVAQNLSFIKDFVLDAVEEVLPKIKGTPISGLLYPKIKLPK